MPLPSSFWTDEIGTAFIVQRPADPSLAAVPQLPVSIYYALPRAAGKLLGFSEIAYRLPSVLLMAIALFLIWQLAVRLIDPQAGWFAVFACLAIADFNYYAADARPYAFGICVACASVYFLIRWLDSASWKFALLFLLFAALLWRIQLVYWAFYPLFPIYTLLRLTRSSTRTGWFQAVGIYAALGLALLPVAFDAVNILHNAKAHVFAPLPRIRLLPGAVSLEIVALSGVCVWLTAQFLKWKIKRPASPGALMLIGLWWLWTPLCLFAFSRLTGTVLFLPRYYSLALPGIALAVTATAALYLPSAWWKQAAVLVAVAALLAGGHWSVLSFDHTQEDWRQASSDADLAADDPDTPILAVSPYIEAQPPVWSPEYKLPGFLYAHLFVYPTRGKVYPLPSVYSRQGAIYAEALVRDTLARRSRFIIYGAVRNTAGWVTWFTARPEFAGWNISLNDSRAVAVVVFQKGF